MIEPPICPYCSQPSVYVDSAEVYQGRSYGMIYLCRPCDAYVGVHKGTEKPLGRLANKELRQWKMKAHAAFDPIWQERARRRRAGRPNKAGKPGGEQCKPVHSRAAAYSWLAQQMGIEREECHIGMFDVELCQRAVEICNPIASKLTITGE